MCFIICQPGVDFTKGTASSLTSALCSLTFALCYSKFPHLCTMFPCLALCYSKFPHLCIRALSVSNTYTKACVV